jgi:hypothetical protein
MVVHLLVLRLDEMVRVVVAVVKLVGVAKSMVMMFWEQCYLVTGCLVETRVTPR